MNAFLLSYIALWVLFLVQCIGLLMLLRQVGMLHLRINPTGARMLPPGPDIGERVKPILLKDLDDQERHVSVNHAMAKDLLILFLSPVCRTCSSLIPSVKAVLRENSELECAILLFSDDKELCRKFRRKHRLSQVFCSYTLRARDHFQIGLTPYGVVIQRDGIVLAKGVVNQIEHLESLLEGRTDMRTVETNDFLQQSNAVEQHQPLPGG